MLHDVWSIGDGEDWTCHLEDELRSDLAMKVIERDGNLYVKEYASAGVICFWPVTYTAASFAQSYGADRLTSLLDGIVRDTTDKENYDFLAPDGIILPILNGGKTRPAWTEKCS
jgi:hypothetical protein